MLPRLADLWGSTHYTSTNFEIPIPFPNDFLWFKILLRTKLTAMLNDLSYAFRTLRKSPIFTITAVVTIALAVGASTAIFSVTNGVLLRQLPYKDPERLVLTCSDMQKRNVKDFPLSNVDYLDLRNGAKNNFEDFAAVNTFRATLPGTDGTPERVRDSSSIDELLSNDGRRNHCGSRLPGFRWDAAAHTSNAGGRQCRCRITATAADDGHSEQRILPTTLWWRSIHYRQTSSRVRSFWTSADHCGCTGSGF